MSYDSRLLESRSSATPKKKQKHTNVCITNVLESRYLRKKQLLYSYLRA